MTRRVRMLGVLTAAVAVAAACGGDAKSRPPIVAPQSSMLDSAEQFMLGVTYTLTNEGVKRGELVADTGYVFDETTRFEFRKVRVDFNTATGVKDGTLTARRGTYSQRLGVLEGWGDVVVVTQDGKKLTSPMLRYNKATDEISTDSAFVFDDGKMVRRGVGMRTDPRLSRVQILRGASGVVREVPVPQQAKP